MERCALADLGFKPDPATMAHRYDVMGNRKPLTGALADFLGGEERVENFRSVFLVDACAVIGNADQDAVIKGCGFDDNLAFGRFASGFLNGLDRIDNQIEKDLVDLVDIARNMRNFRVKLFDHVGIVFPFIARNHNDV